MGWQNLLGKIGVTSDSQESASAFLDLGTRSMKLIAKKQAAITTAVAEETGTNKAVSVATLLKKNSLSGARVRLALKGQDTIIRYVPFPKMEKANLRQSFAFEAAKHLPFPVESVYFDLCVLEENYSKTESLILLAAAKKDLVNPIVEEFAKERITVSEITLSGIALLNLFLATNSAAENYALIDIGNSAATLNIIKKDLPYLSREIKTGGKAIIKKLAALKNVEMSQAEFLYIKGDNAEELLEIGEDIFLGICEEIRSSFDYFEMNTGEQVQSICLTGGFALLNGVDKIISGALGVEVKPWKPWEKLGIKFPEEVMLPKELFTTAIGLMV